MVPLLGMFVVLGAVAGGFALENGRFAPLVQVPELLIICGAGLGTLCAANPADGLRKTGAAVLRVFRGAPVTRAFYLSSLVMLHALFGYARRQGPTRLEDQVDHPGQSSVFRQHAAAVRDAEALGFICDTLRLTVMAPVPGRDLDELLERDLGGRPGALSAPAKTMETLADSLPGLGILSAVLGVVITMASLAEAPQSIGLKVGSALVGTFLGIFLSYGFVGPLASHLKRIDEGEAQYYRVLAAALAAFGKGMPPGIAVEFARRTIPPDLRPGFSEMEAELRASRREVEGKQENSPVPQIYYKAG